MPAALLSHNTTSGRFRANRAGAVWQRMCTLQKLESYSRDALLSLNHRCKGLRRVALKLIEESRGADGEKRMPSTKRSRSPGGKETSEGRKTKPARVTEAKAQTSYKITLWSVLPDISMGPRR